MPTFEIEQYEIHVQKYHVTAKSEAAAIKKLYDGKARAVDEGPEFVEVCEDLGLPIDDYADLAEELESLGVTFTDVVIPSIRSVEEVE